MTTARLPSRRVRTLLPPGLLAALLVAAAGCGEQVEPPIGRAETTPSAQAAQAAPEVLELVSFSAIGDVPPVTEEPTRVDTAGGRAAYLEGFAERTRGALEQALDRAGEPGRVAPGSALTATVVEVGCEEARGVDVERAGAGWRVAAVPTGAPTTDCLVPVVTVALVALPAPGR